MKTISGLVALEGFLLVGAGIVGWSVGCGAATSAAYSLDGGVPGFDAGGGSHTGTITQCEPCVVTASCNGGLCAQFSGDTFCAVSCASGASACPSGTSCTIEADYAGNQVSVCVPANNQCGGGTASSGGGGSGTGTGQTCTTTAGTGSCPGYDAPDTPSSCSGCKSSSSSCQANGCYGGWYCDTATDKCHAPPTDCTGGAPVVTCTGGSSTGGGGGGSTGGGGGGSSSGGGTSSGSGSGTTPGSVTGTVTGAGGTLSSLLFGIVGDTRPANEDDTSGYPTSIIDSIYSDIEARSPRPPFVVSSGDYQFASTSGSESSPQLSLYLAARKNYSGVLFPAMGNHECTGATASNCGSGNTNGVTKNYSNFLSMMLGPISQTNPYYSFDVNASDGSWTAKFVVVAANAWDSSQSSWLDSTLSRSTTYTFVLRHEATEANTAPGVSPSDSIISSHPLTLEICGHTHDYSKKGNKIVLGNGGAPLTGGGDYGYGIVAQRSDGDIVVDEYDYKTNQADSSFHFVVTPSGQVTN